MKLFDSELKVMEALWKGGDMTAGGLAKKLKEQIGWNRNTTYTIIKKLIEKGAIKREEPSYTCIALISKQEVQKKETEELVDKLFDGSSEIFLSTFLGGKNLSKKEIERLKKIIEELQ